MRFGWVYSLCLSQGWMLCWLKCRAGSTYTIGCDATVLDEKASASADGRCDGVVHPGKLAGAHILYCISILGFAWQGTGQAKMLNRIVRHCRRTTMAFPPSTSTIDHRLTLQAPISLTGQGGQAIPD